MVLLDDGFQNSKINKDLSLVVVDSEVLFGNEFIFPLGPLREPISSGLSRADAIILVDNNHKNTHKIDRLKTDNKIPVLKGCINKKKKSTNNKNKEVLAFSGIAFPDKFFKTLKDMGYTVIKTKVFPDHYPYTLKDMIKLKNYAENYGLKLITTEKDIVRVPKRFHEFIDIIQIEFQFKNSEKIKEMIKKILN